MGAADDEGQQARRAAELAAVEDELCRAICAVAQREHRLRQHGTLAAQIDGDDGLVVQAGGGVRPDGIDGSGQPGRFDRGCGEHHRIEACAVDAP